MGKLLDGFQDSTPFLDRKLIYATSVLVLLAAGSQITDRSDVHAQTNEPNSPVGLIELWEGGQTAFGQYVTGVPYTVETGRDLAANTLLDYAFLNLEQEYNINSALELAEGLRSGAGGDPMDLLVRIPPMSEAGVETSRARVNELLAMGADGVVFPHVRSAEEARVAISFFDGVNVWSPANPEGDIVVMLMLETPEVFAELEEIANIPNYSALACGIGSLTGALGGDREAAEKLNLQLLAESQRVGLADMITANTESVARRVNEGFLGLLVYGPAANEVIRLGRVAAGR
jgi:2-keto-3-deoxy-L-rhamnonate aldolase RhmA